MWTGGAGCACSLVVVTCSYFSLPHEYVWVRSQGSYHSPVWIQGHSLQRLIYQVPWLGIMSCIWPPGLHSRYLAPRSIFCCSRCHWTVPYFPIHSLSLRSQFGPQLVTQIRNYWRYTVIFIDTKEIHSRWHLHVLSVMKVDNYRTYSWAPALAWKDLYMSP